MFKVFFEPYVGIKYICKIYLWTQNARKINTKKSTDIPRFVKKKKLDIKF